MKKRNLSVHVAGVASPLNLSSVEVTQKQFGRIWCQILVVPILDCSVCPQWSQERRRRLKLDLEFSFRCSCMEKRFAVTVHIGGNRWKIQLKKSCKKIQVGMCRWTDTILGSGIPSVRLIQTTQPIFCGAGFACYKTGSSSDMIVWRERHNLREQF